MDAIVGWSRIHGNPLLSMDMIRAPAGQNQRPEVCEKRLMGNPPRNTGAGQGEEPFPAQTAKQPRQSPFRDRRGRFSADSQHPSAPISEAKV